MYALYTKISMKMCFALHCFNTQNTYIFVYANISIFLPGAFALFTRKKKKKLKIKKKYIHIHINIKIGERPQIKHDLQI